MCLGNIMELIFYKISNSTDKHEQPQWLQKPDLNKK